MQLQLHLGHVLQSLSLSQTHYRTMVCWWLNHNNRTGECKQQTEHEKEAAIIITEGFQNSELNIQTRLSDTKYFNI